jgi:CubicO group peptidase (beta-lactamase class C family)
MSAPGGCWPRGWHRSRAGHRLPSVAAGLVRDAELVWWQYHYSNVGYALLGELVARLRGRPWYDVIAEELLAPLRMSRTTLRPQPPHATGFAVHPHADLPLPEPEHDAEAMAPASQLWTTITDLARWAHKAPVRRRGAGAGRGGSRRLARSPSAALRSLTGQAQAYARR